MGEVGRYLIEVSSRICSDSLWTAGFVPPPPFSIHGTPSFLLSKSYQAVISKSGVIWVLPRGGAQLKLCLAQIRDTQKLLAPPQGLHHLSPFFKLLLCFLLSLYPPPSLPLFLSVCPFLSLLSFWPSFVLSLPSRFNFFVVLIIQRQFCLAVILFVLSRLDEKTPAANWPIRPAPDDIIVTCMRKVYCRHQAKSRKGCNWSFPSGLFFPPQFIFMHSHNWPRVFAVTCNCQLYSKLVQYYRLTSITSFTLRCSYILCVCIIYLRKTKWIRMI